MSEIVELDSGSLSFMGKIYPRRSTSIGIVSRYADAMGMGAIFPPPAVALVEGKNAIVDGVHRIKAMDLLSGSLPRKVKVEFLGEMTEEQAFEESVRRNAIHGSRFDASDLRKIVGVFEKHGRDLSYVSGVLRMSKERLEFRRESPRSVSYPSGARNRTEGQSSPLGMGFQDLISWTMKFVREGKVGDDTVDSLTQLRDEINSYLARRREDMKAGRESLHEASGDEMNGKDGGIGEPTDDGSKDSQGIDLEVQTGIIETLRKAGGNPLTIASLCSRLRRRGVLKERISGHRLSKWLKNNPDIVWSGTYLARPSFMLRENAERYLPPFLGDGPQDERLPAGTEGLRIEEDKGGNSSSARKAVDVGTFTRAIMNSFKGMDEEEARKTAFQVLSYFGYERRCLANHLDEGDNQAFYMLEDKGLVKSTSYETILVDGRPWRTVEFELVYEKIMEAASVEKEGKDVDVYAGLPEEAWAR